MINIGKDKEYGSWKGYAIVYAISMLTYAVIWIFISITSNISNTYEIELRGIGAIQINRWEDILIFFPVCCTIAFYMLLRFPAKVAEWKWANTEDIHPSSLTGFATMFVLMLFLALSFDLSVLAIVIISAIILALCYSGYYLLYEVKGTAIGFAIGGAVGTAFACGLVLGWLPGMMVMAFGVAVIMLIISMVRFIQKEKESH